MEPQNRFCFNRTVTFTGKPDGFRPQRQPALLWGCLVLGLSLGIGSTALAKAGARPLPVSEASADIMKNPDSPAPELNSGDDAIPSTDTDPAPDAESLDSPPPTEVPVAPPAPLTPVTPPNADAQELQPPVAAPSADVAVQSPEAQSPAHPSWRTTPRRHLTLLGGGGAFGLIFPAEVNDYMEDWMNAQGDIATVESGYTQMVLSFVPNISLVYAPIEYLGLELFAEFGWAPKILMVQNGDSEVFNFTRFSPGLNVLAHIPFRHYKNSFFIGPGVELDMMRFEKFRANSLGIRGKLGVRIYTRKTVIDAFGAFLYTKKDSNRIAGNTLELNFTSVLFGASVYFYLHGK